MPTPAIAYLTRTQHARTGIVISASHNPYHDNGIKFFSAEGTKLPDAVELAIEALDKPLACNDSAQLGKATRLEDAAGRYIEFCKSTFPHHLDLAGLKIVVDCAHGATYHVAPAVFGELGAEVVAIGVEPDGLNINDGVGSTHPGLLQHTVVETGADLGIALDGDGDRVLMVDRDGTLLDGDELLYIIAMERHHRYVMERLQAADWQLGGESSGHIICLDRTTTGDGIVSALQVLGAMVGSGRSLSELRAGMTKYPQELGAHSPAPFRHRAAGAGDGRGPGCRRSGPCRTGAGRGGALRHRGRLSAASRRRCPLCSLSSKLLRNPRKSSSPH